MKKRKNKENKESRLYYLNHKNLIGEIENYGYVFKFRKLLFTYLCVLAGCILAGLLYKLPLYGYVVIIVFALLQTPFLVRNYYKSLYEQRRFSDASKYVERMLYYFKAKGKVLDALNDVEKVFPEGRMKDCIGNAVRHIQDTVDENAVKDALEIIEQEYSCRRIKRLHTFLLQIENDGGDMDMGVETLLRDRQIWTDTKVMFQKQKRNVKILGMISLTLSFAMCLITLYIPMMFNIEMLDISTNNLVQISAVIMILYFLRVYSGLDKKLCINWLDEKEAEVDKIKKMYEMYIHYDVRKQGRKFFLYSAVLVIFGLILAVILHTPAPLVISGIVALLLVNYPSFNQKTVGRYLKKQIKNEFPTWVVQVSLQMQNNNVVMSIARTLETAPAILQPAIEKFIEQTEAAPEDVAPFNDFLSEFNLNEISEIMSTLYSISSGTGADMQTEFKEILKRNNDMLEKAENRKNDDKIVVMKNMSVSKPAIAAGFKLLVDTILLMISFFAKSMEMF